MTADHKARLREFWQAQSCGEIYASGETAREKFRTQATARYLLEPYIRGFAKFEEGTDRDVLEIGVGMGADHLEWAKSRPRRLVGIDLTQRAIDLTAQRFEIENFDSELAVGDAENLDFPDCSFDIVYSWGVVHHSPDTPQAFREAYRVLRPGGQLRAMIYHRPSMVGLVLWARYGLGAGKPRRSLTEIYAEHLQGGTKGYTVKGGQQLVSQFSKSSVRSIIGFGDLLVGDVGQMHNGRLLKVAKAIWPRPIIKHLHGLGLLLLVEATKQEDITVVRTDVVEDLQSPRFA